jgi:hypothetical protein
MAYVIIFHGHHLASFCPVPTLPHTLHEFAWQ